MTNNENLGTPTMKRSLTMLAGTALLLAGSAHAQSPSADSIIKSLQPRGPLTGTTRGIRPQSGGLAAPAAEPAAPAPHTAGSAMAKPPGVRPATPVATAAPSVNLTVQFATNSAELTPAATRTLDELGRALASPALGAFHFRIEGHTDTVGSPDANKSLSDRRAAKVVDYLATKFGVDRARLESVGMGQDGLMVQTPPNTAEPRNRRVQVVNLGA